MVVGRLRAVRLSGHPLFFIISDSTDKIFLVRASYMEIYNEGVYDLLAEVGKSIKESQLTFVKVLVRYYGMSNSRGR